MNATITETAKNEVYAHIQSVLTWITSQPALVKIHGKDRDQLQEEPIHFWESQREWLAYSSLEPKQFALLVVMKYLERKANKRRVVLLFFSLCCVVISLICVFFQLKHPHYLFSAVQLTLGIVATENLGRLFSSSYRTA